MRFDQLTIKAQEAIQEAQRDARARGSAELSPDQLLLALLRQSEGVVVPILQKLGVDPDALARETEQELDRIIGVLFELTERWFQAAVTIAFRPRPG